jgi:hypothetical protein
MLWMLGPSFTSPPFFDAMTWPHFCFWRNKIKVPAWWSRSRLKTTMVNDSMHNVLMNWCSDAIGPSFTSRPRPPFFFDAMTWSHFVFDVTKVSAWWSRSSLKTMINDSMQRAFELMLECYRPIIYRALYIPRGQRHSVLQRTSYWTILYSYIFVYNWTHHLACALDLGILHIALLWTSSRGGSCAYRPWHHSHGVRGAAVTHTLLNKNFMFTAEVLHVLRTYIFKECSK